MKMTIIAIFLLCLTIKATFAEKCPKPATCPCGSNGYNITVCASGTALAEFCSRFSKCEACEDGKDFCAKCPEGLSGPTCSRELKKTRQKRQTLHRYFRRRVPRSCSELNTPHFGIKKCSSNTCTAKCFAGYHFEDSVSQDEMTLWCRGGVWTPRTFFPKCKSAGYCDTFLQKAGTANCTVDSSRTWCDVRCGTRHMGRFTCYPGRAWEPTLPLCVTLLAKFHGEHCYNPGPILNGKVQYFAPGKTERGENLDYEVEWFREGSIVEYSCDKDLIIQGSPRLTCQKTGKWSTAKPTCVSANDYDRTFCENPGRVLNAKVLYFAPGARNGPGVKLESEMDEYPEGSALEFYCDPGFWIEGSQSLMCESTGFWSSSRPTCVEACGRSVLPSSQRIRDGQETMTGEWPWVVFISLIGDDGRESFVCGGAIFNSRAVVTAAHCLERNRTYILRYGKHHFDVEDDEDQVLNRTSSRVIIHPDYKNKTLDSDIGLIVFEPPIEYSDRIMPICMPTLESTRRNIRPGNLGYVSGWGDKEMELPANSLLFAGLPVMNTTTCVKSYRSQNLTLFMTANNFCAGFYNRAYSICGGDSGSPFVFYDNLSHRFTLEGLVSFVVRMRTDAQECGLPGRYAIFTRVFRFVPWLHENSEYIF